MRSGCNLWTKDHTAGFVFTKHGIGISVTGVKDPSGVRDPTGVRDPGGVRDSTGVLDLGGVHDTCGIGICETGGVTLRNVALPGEVCAITRSGVGAKTSRTGGARIAWGVAGVEGACAVEDAAGKAHAGVGGAAGSKAVQRAATLPSSVTTAYVVQVTRVTVCGETGGVGAGVICLEGTWLGESDGGGTK